MIDDKTMDIVQHIEELPPNKAQTVGYVRVSSDGQNIDRQLDGVEIDKVFIDRVSGSKKNRPELNRLLEYVRDGDTVVIHSLDRLARDLGHLIEITKKFNDKGVTLRSLKENLFFDARSSNPLNQFLFHVIGAVAEFNRSLIREAQKEGIEKAKKRGVYKGRKPSLSDEQVQKLRDFIAEKNKSAENYKSMKWKDIAVDLGVSESTVFRYASMISKSED